MLLKMRDTEKVSIYVNINMDDEVVDNVFRLICCALYVIKGNRVFIRPTFNPPSPPSTQVRINTLNT